MINETLLGSSEILLGAAAAGALAFLLAAGAFLSLRRALHANARATEGLGEELRARMERQDARQEAFFADARRDLDSARENLDWLAGDRMIEEAVALVRSGASEHEVGDRLGLGEDTVRTLTRLRAH